jgi:hypothetical protein
MSAGEGEAAAELDCASRRDEQPGRASSRLRARDANGEARHAWCGHLDGSLSAVTVTGKPVRQVCGVEQHLAHDVRPGGGPACSYRHSVVGDGDRRAFVVVISLSLAARPYGG